MIKLTSDEVDAIRHGLTTELMTQVQERYRSTLKKLRDRIIGKGAFELFIDGAADLHTKRAGIGGVIFRDGNELYTFSEYLDNATNNEAEYQALITGVRSAWDLNIKVIRIKSDSELIVKQINGQYKVKHPNMVPLYKQAISLLNKFDSWSLSHVPREENKVADKLSKDGLKAND